MTVTVAQLAQSKDLPEKFLRDIGLENRSKGVHIPYYGLNGKPAKKRIRTAVSAKEGSRWDSDDKAEIVPYGLWQIPRMSGEYLFLVEGESDCWTLWHHEMPAIGIPGVTMCHVLQLQHIETFKRVIIWEESDRGGQQFRDNLRERLMEIGFTGEVFVIRGQDAGAKDPNDLHRRDPDEFTSQIEGLQRNAKSLNLWPDPVIPTEPLPPVPFPTDVLPAPAAKFVREQAAALGVEEAIVGPYVLGAMAAAIGGTHEVQMKSGWRESTNLYIILIAEPGTGKSPALDAAVKPLHTRQQQFNRENELAREQYEEELAEYERQLNLYTRNKTPEKPKKPKMPPSQRVFYTDTTIEALAAALNDNPRGVVLIVDEATAWTRSVNMYRGGRGSDRQFYLSGWARAHFEQGRKTQKQQISVPRPHLCVLGAIPPEVLGDLADETGRDDGFLHRILFAYPNVQFTRLGDAEVPQGIRDEYNNLVQNLFALQPQEESHVLETGETLGERKPAIVTLTPDAWKAGKQWVNWLKDQLEAGDVWERMRGPIAKIDGHLFRLALVLHVAEQVARGNAKPAQVPIGPETMQAAIRLGKFFLTHSERAYRRLSGQTQATDDSEVIAAYVLKKAVELAHEEGSNRVPHQSLWQKTKKKREIDTTDDLAGPLRWLEDNGCIKTLDEPTGGRHRKFVLLHPTLVGENNVPLGPKRPTGLASRSFRPQPPIATTDESVEEQSLRRGVIRRDLGAEDADS